MANPEHLANIMEGLDAWNDWRNQNPHIEVDLNGVDLSEAELNEASLFGVGLREADLSGASLCVADLSEASLIDANLSDANLSGANLIKADLSGAKLIGAKLRAADLSEANLSKANLREAKLILANLIEANLTEAGLRDADLGGANLSRVDLSGADLNSATLQHAMLDGAKATGIKLWETQRAGWSIKGIICERAYWDKEGKEPTEYAPGEFERLYSDQACIELFYPGGTTSFELNTLPALLHHLASLHPETNIRLKSIEETGGGAKIRISVGDADKEKADSINADAVQVVQAQLALRDDELNRERIEKKYLEKLLFGGLIPAMLTAGAPQNVFNAPVSRVVISNDESKVDFHQTVNDNSALLALLEKIMDRRGELGLSTAKAAELEHEYQSTKAELGKKSPDNRVVSRGIEFFKKVAAETATKAAGKFEEKVVSGDWQNWIHQLSQFLHHLK